MLNLLEQCPHPPEFAFWRDRQTLSGPDMGTIKCSDKAYEEMMKCSDVENGNMKFRLKKKYLTWFLQDCSDLLAEYPR